MASSVETPAIAVIGANGQVGTEVCLFLAYTAGARVIPICRAERSAAFLSRCGLECRIGAVTDTVNAGKLLGGADLVADFSAIRGLPGHIRQAMRANITGVVRHAPPRAKAVFISTEMAFGMRFTDQHIANHLVSRTVYGATKRYGERMLFSECRKEDREGYVLRLGQVHGELQNVSHDILSRLDGSVIHVPDALSDTVFAFTIAEALVNIARGQERPGLYTLVSHPQWRWSEVHDYYAKRAGVRPGVVLVRADERSAVRRRVSNVLGFLKSTVTSVATSNREMITAYLLRAAPEVQHRLAAAYYCRQAAAQLAGLEQSRMRFPYGPIVGPAPGRKLQSISDSRFTMLEATERVRRILSSGPGGQT